MRDTSTTSIDLDKVEAHLLNSATITDEYEPKIDDLITLEAGVVAACDRGPGPVAVKLTRIINLWRTHDAKLQTIYDVLIKTGKIRISVATRDLRDLVGRHNGVDARGSFDLIDDGLNYVIAAGGGNDDIVIDQNNDGTVDITINGITVTLTEEQTQHLWVDGGVGDDTIIVNPVAASTPHAGRFGALNPIGIRIDGGNGNDSITGGSGMDIIDGGAGRDYIDGGRGDDELTGGSGFDTIYGGRGRDYLFGGEDDDYLDGGRGDDRLYGGIGEDILAGGDGADRLAGGSDDDVMIGGRGVDRISDWNTGDADQVYAEAIDSVGTNSASTTEIFEIYDPDTSQISISGTQQFRDRTQADLDTLAAIPIGAAALTSIDNNPGNHTVTITESDDGNNRARPDDRGKTWELDGKTGSGSSGTVFYAPDKTKLSPNEPWASTPPNVALYHELLHAEDYVYGELDPGKSEQVEHDGHGHAVSGTSGNQAQTDQSGNNRIANNRELSVVGIPFDESDSDTGQNPSISPAADVDTNTRPHTENALREQLNLPERTRY